MTNTGDQLSDLAKRLAIAVEKAGGPAPVARGSGVPLSTLGRYMRAQSEPSTLKLAPIARYCGVSIEYLVFGDEFPQGLMQYAAQTSVLPNVSFPAPNVEDVAFIPLLDVVAHAGPGFENAFPYELRRLPFPRNWLHRLALPEASARFLDSRGDSMEPTIRDGSLILCDVRFQQARHDGVYVLVVGSDVRVKRLRLGWNGAIQLISDNPRYKEEELAPPEAEALRIAGRVVWAGGAV